jgi:predicted DNA-binding transcriptional regulator YafY
LNACFTNRQHRYWTKQQLLDELAKHDIFIEARSLDRDLHYMRHNEQLKYFAPIQYCAIEKGYYYTDADFSIEKINIIQEELVSLLFCKHLYQQFKGSSMATRLDGVFDKMISHSKPDPTPYTQALLVDNTLMYTQGLEHLDVLLHAVYHQQPVKMTHQKYDEKKVTTHILHPYFLKAYNGRLYVYGKSNAYSINLTFGLDRMLTVEETDVPFVPNTRTNPVDFFNNIIGVTMGKGPIREVRLKFTALQGYYIKSKSLHASQAIVQDDKSGLIVTLQLIPNYELMSLLLGFGKSVKVLAPDSLCVAMKAELEEALKQYSFQESFMYIV